MAKSKINYGKHSVLDSDEFDPKYERAADPKYKKTSITVDIATIYGEKYIGINDLLIYLYDAKSKNKTFDVQELIDSLLDLKDQV